MSDDLDIRAGGVVAVDTASLRQAAAQYAALGDELQHVVELLGDEAHRLVDTGGTGAAPDRLLHTAWRLRGGVDEAAAVARMLRELADVYDLVELHAERALADSAAQRADLDARLAARASANPDAARRALLELAGRPNEIAHGLASPDNGIGPALFVPAMALLEVAQGALMALHRGRITAGRRVDGDAPPTSLIRLRSQTNDERARAPRDLADALKRMPSGDARIRVETYTMPDGSARYAVYLAGTRDFSLTDKTAEPWNMQANLRLHAGHDAASYRAVRAAMADAGVPAGAPAYVFGHSQGGMLADWLAAAGDYDTRLLVTAGSPTEADVGERTLSVQLRHTDDLVPSLAAGGSPGRVGAPGSMVVESTGDPGFGIRDIGFAAHQLGAYVATAKALDASSDPRAAAVGQRLGELRGARSVTTVEYDARRARKVSGSSSDAG
jgi:hypothetical protein